MARRGSPVRLVAAFTFVCAAPLAAVVATGLAHGAPASDKVETSGSAAASPHDPGSDAGTPNGGPPPTGTADLGDTPTSGSPTTTGTTGSKAPPSTGTPTTPAPGSTAPPGTPGTSPTTGGSGGGAGGGSGNGGGTTATTTVQAGQVEQVVTLVNQARAQASPKCAALRVDIHLTAAAQGHSDDMVAEKYFSHDTPAGVGFAARVQAAGYPRPGGENIAQGQTSAQQVMSDWMASAGHRANIVNCKFTTIGVGLNTVGWTWTQDFGY
jgi:uncharacterized protein YkwD